jgi:hypothetical protein
MWWKLGEVLATGKPRPSYFYAIAASYGIVAQPLFQGSCSTVLISSLCHQFERELGVRPTAELGEFIIQLRLRIAVIRAWKNYRNRLVTYAKYGRRAK